MHFLSQLSLSIFFSFLIICLSPWIDRAFSFWINLWKTRNHESLSIKAEIEWLTHLIACMRAGISLQNALERYTKERKDPYLKKISYSILHGEPPKKGVFLFLFQALRLGTSVLSVLQLRKQQLRKQLQLNKKLKSLSVQARTQAWIAIFLPWSLLLFLYSFHGDILSSASKGKYFWILLSLAIALDILAAYWIRYLMKKTLDGKNPIEKSIHKWVPTVLLQSIQNIQLGLDLERSLENAVMLIPKEDPLRKMLLKPSSDATPLIRYIHELFYKSSRTGSPITEDIYEIINDIREEREVKMEENCQLLPIKLLMPIFLLILPASLLTLAAPIIMQLEAF